MPTKYLKKLIVLLSVVIISFALHINIVSGEEIPLTTNEITQNIIDDSLNSEITDEALKLDLKIVNQEFISRKITVELKITPSIDSGKVGVDWIYDKNLFTIIGESRDVVTLNKDTELILKKDFVPITQYKRTGDFNTQISVRVTATAFDISYLSTRNLSFAMNSKYEITPLLTDYGTIKNAAFYGSILLIIIGSATLISLFAVLLNKFLIYLNTDEEK